MNPIPAFAVLAGQLVGIAFACGLNLYATVGLLGLASRFGWMPQLPPGLRGLENSVIIGTALILFFVEFVVEKVKYAGAIWDAIHTIVRPLAAAMLAVLALGPMPWEVKLAGAAAAAAVAFAAHSSQAGIRVMIANSRFTGTAAITVTTIIIDATAIALALVTMRYPETALAIVGVALLLSVVIGPRLWRAAGFGAEAVVRRVRRFFGRQGWLLRDALPVAIRRVIPPPELGRSPARGARAAAVGVPGAGAYRTGWLVVSDDGNAFVYRTFISARRVPLPVFAESTIDPGPLSDALHFKSQTRSYTLLLLKDGPSAQIALAALQETR